MSVCLCVCAYALHLCIAEKVVLNRMGVAGLIMQVYWIHAYNLYEWLQAYDLHSHNLCQ